MSNWYGEFNYQGELWHGNTKAQDPGHAFLKLTIGMSRRYQVTPKHLRDYFHGKAHSYTITRLKEAIDGADLQRLGHAGVPSKLLGALGYSVDSQEVIEEKQPQDPGGEADHLEYLYGKER
jgi:hypothetical protein